MKQLCKAWSLWNAFLLFVLLTSAILLSHTLAQVLIPQGQETRLTAVSWGENLWGFWRWGWRTPAAVRAGRCLWLVTSDCHSPWTGYLSIAHWIPPLLLKSLRERHETTSRMAARRWRHAWENLWEERGAKESSILDLFSYTVQKVSGSLQDEGCLVSYQTFILFCLTEPNDLSLLSCTSIHGNEEPRLWSQQTWIVLTLPFTSCVVLGNLLNISGLVCSFVKWAKISTYLILLWWELNETM